MSFASDPEEFPADATPEEIAGYIEALGEAEDEGWHDEDEDGYVDDPEGAYASGDLGNEDSGWPAILGEMRASLFGGDVRGAVELASASGLLSHPAVIEGAAQRLAARSGDAWELAAEDLDLNDTLSGIAEELDAIGEREMLAAEEDAEAASTRRGTAEILEQAYSRIAAGTYSPGQRDDLGYTHAPFGGVSEGNVTGQAACGPADDLGYCMNAHHEAGCGSVADPEVTREVIGAGAYARASTAPFADSRGRFFRDQEGNVIDVVGAVEASLGLRLSGDHGNGLFERGGLPRRELVSPQREAVLGDPESGDSRPFPASTSVLAGRVLAASQHSLRSPAPDRQRWAARRDDYIARRMQRQGWRTHPDLGETARERAARIKAERPGRLAAVDTDGAGTVAYTYA